MDTSDSNLLSVRKAMKTYWDKWSKYNTESGTSFEMMLLETQSRYEFAKKLSDLDRKEIVSLLPDLKGLEVLELGAGIGRFTGKLARKAKSVLATDFMEKFIRDNEVLNGRKYTNITFSQLDASKIPYSSEVFDFVFSNWLLMYLGDAELQQFALDTLRILRNGGYLFFRESCFHTSGRIVRADNPSVYRSIKDYQALFSSIRYTTEDGVTYCYDLVFSGNCQTYILLKNNPSQVYWLWKKRKYENDDVDGLKLIDIQNTLDSKFYSAEHMAVYESVIGDGFVTPGGLRATKEIMSHVTLVPHAVMLDVGCGLGGTMIYMANEHADVDITGFELSPNAVQGAILNLNQLKSSKGHICVRDLYQTNLPSSCFDVIFVKETLIYFMNQKELLFKFQKWLKVKGQLVLADYCLGSTFLSDSVLASLVAQGVEPLDLVAINETLTDAGYTLSFTDLSRDNVMYLQQALLKLETIEGIPDTCKLSFQTKWKLLLFALETQQLTWNVLVATKQMEK